MRGVKFVAIALGWLYVVFLCGCATIINGQNQRLSIISEPPGARATVLQEGIELETPAHVELSRGKVYTIRFELDGYDRDLEYVDRTDSKAINWNILLGGLIGLMVDMSSDARFKLVPDPVSVKLEPISSNHPVDEQSRP